MGFPGLFTGDIISRHFLNPFSIVVKNGQIKIKNGKNVVLLKKIKNGKNEKKTEKKII